MAKLLKIIKIPDQNLRKKSEIVSKAVIDTKELQELCEDMEKTMVEKEGVGLAAPQVGKNIRLIVVNTKKGPIALFNPKIIGKSWLKEWGEEGCLSVPMVFGDVRRHKRITCVFCNRQGEEEEIKASGFLARIIQHEADHLDGIIFIDKAKNLRELDENGEEHPIKNIN
jgi:peptide deformylase